MESPLSDQSIYFADGKALSVRAFFRKGTDNELQSRIRRVKADDYIRQGEMKAINQQC